MPDDANGSTEMLIGRAAELAALDRTIRSVTQGSSAVLLMTGDAGIGKTLLLHRLEELAELLTVVRLVGVETEAQLPFAAVQRLVSLCPVGDDLLPPPPREALRVAIGLQALPSPTGQPPDRFLVGLAVQSLLAAAAQDAPILVIVDDLQWLDQESTDALAFAARRLRTERVGLVLGRRTDQPVPAFDGFTELVVHGLQREDALTLLRTVVTRRLDARIADQIVTATAGNPLAIIDLAQELSTHQLVGLTLVPEPLPVGSHLEAHYLRRTRELPDDVQNWLLLAAAEPTGDPAAVAGAAAVLGIGSTAADVAEAGNLVRVDRRIEFRHPLVRSAIYSGATSGQRRRAHNALAAVIRRERDIDRHAWHRAAGCVGHDEDVAAMLESSAERAGERGGYSARATFLARAVELSADGDGHTRRSLLAAEAALTAGRPGPALALLDDLDGVELTGSDRGRALMIRASAQAFTGTAGAMAGVPAIYAEAAAAFQHTAPALARDALLTAFERSLAAEWLMSGTTLRELADVALRLASAERGSLADLLLIALGRLVTTPFRDAAPDLRSAVEALCSPDTGDADLLRYGWLSVALTTALWDEDAKWHILSRSMDIARRTGNLHSLDALLYISSVAATELGQLAAAGDLLAELRRVRDALGMSQAQQEMFRNIEYLAWRATEPDLPGCIESSAQAALYLGLGGAETLARNATMITGICAGDYDTAYRIARRNHDLDFMQISIRALPDLIETSARSGRPDEARAAFDELREISVASGTPRVLGLLERSAAVLAEDGDPEPAYSAAIAHLTGTRALSDLARTHLLYGEWLRRRKRRRDARAQLGCALALFEEMGATAFAARARRELAATGPGQGHPQASSGASGDSSLTAQERAVAGLAATGATNAEIATALVISPHTVDYHLRKIYRKLGISSRRELVRRVPT
ncbi:helix-turn-helix transcriptional regulator [Nakamurella sp. GG22]